MYEIRKKSLLQAGPVDFQVRMSKWTFYLPALSCNGTLKRNFSSNFNLLFSFEIGRSQHPWLLVLISYTINHCSYKCFSSWTCDLRFQTKYSHCIAKFLWPTTFLISCNFVIPFKLNIPNFVHMHRIEICRLQFQLLCMYLDEPELLFI